MAVAKFNHLEALRSWKKKTCIIYFVSVPFFFSLLNGRSHVAEAGLLFSVSPSQVKECSPLE